MSTSPAILLPLAFIHIKTKTIMALKGDIESVVDAQKQEGGEADFSMAQLYAAAWPQIEKDASIAPLVPRLQKLGEKRYRKLGYAILRNVYLIELVKKPKIETTKFRFRWIDELKADPRGCSFDECMEIARGLLLGLPAWANADKQHLETLILCFEESMLSLTEN